ncbi:glycosyltransferase [Flavobacterium sp. J27]|uniref:glycosyltransferase n=1 Tax=Flavobacterium sp. J27 TaxID=2060419 RepID=UPI001F0F7800|nr:glycosyltransferase [Flavobacterium sp. J27]
MKIVMVSIPSLHFFRWVNQLKDTEHEIYWFDITGMSKQVSRINWLHQKNNWKLKWDYPGRQFVKNKFPKLYKTIQIVNEYNTEAVFEAFISEIQPDVVHSFALYLSCSPILKTMNKYPKLKWVYSSWGSDLYYFQNESLYLKDIQAVLPRINYLFTDCNRDYEIAKNHGFKGVFLGVFPGGGGFELERMEKYKLPLIARKTILIKGFQGRSGRVLSVLKAVEQISSRLKDYKIKVFGSDKEVIEYVKKRPIQNWNNFTILGKISHEEVLQLMGEALYYIGNSNSDGMPNTLLEAICMGAIPIQSNPGGATEEIITNNVNGILIEDCESIEKIVESIENALKMNTLAEVQKYNFEEIALKIEYKVIEKAVREKYLEIM